MDYSKYEGKVVGMEYVHSSDSIGYYNAAGRVVGCDPDIGITIVGVFNKDKYLLCLNGPSSPQFKKKNGRKRHAEVLFYAIVKMIHNGFIDQQEISRIKESLVRGIGMGREVRPSAESCSFAGV